MLAKVESFDFKRQSFTRGGDLVSKLLAIGDFF
jgi:hypothetical protein